MKNKMKDFNNRDNRFTGEKGENHWKGMTAGL